MSEEEKTPPLGTDDPVVLTNPGEAPPPPYEQLKNNTYNNPPHEDDLLTWGAKEFAVGIIKVNDIIPPKDSKRYQKYIAIYISTDKIKNIKLEFRGAKPAMGTTEQMIEKSPVIEGLDMLHEMSGQLSP